MQELFPDTTLTGRDPGRLDGYFLSVTESGAKAHQLALLWLLRQPLARPEWHRILGTQAVSQGLRWGLINGSVLTHLEACFDAQPALGNIVLSDPKFRQPWEHDQHGVYYLGSDSYALVNTVPRDPVETALDLFTGSGVHAVLAAEHADDVVGVDINPRAVGMARVNAAINRRANCTFIQGDLFSRLGDRKFDLITANPPFVPTPDQDLALYRSGGESGELLTRRLLQQLHHHLKPGGMLAMVTNYPVFHDLDILDHHRGLLGEPEQFGIALLHSYTFPREMYIQMHLSPSGDLQQDRKATQRWLESYQRQNIKGVGFGVLFFCHLTAGRPWSARKDAVDLVHKPLSGEVARWLQGLRKFASGVAPPHRLRFHPEVLIYAEKRTGKGVLAWESDWPSLQLDAEETRIALELLKTEPFSMDSSNEAFVRKLGSEGALY